MNSQSHPDDILSLLHRHQAPCLVIGGHAVAVHGYLRTTEDTDLIYWRAADPDERLLDALLEVHACWIGDQRDPATGLEELHPIDRRFFRNQRLMMLTTDLGYLDIFDFIPGFPDTDPAELFRDAIELAGVKYVSLSWLRRIKQAAGRPRDLEDLHNLPEPDE